MLALHGSRLAQTAPGAAAAPFDELAAHAWTRNAGHAMVLEAALGDALDTLAHAGIRAVPIKGPLLARSAHGDAALRQSIDLDILVARDDLVAAVAALTAAGYAAPPDRVRPDGLPELHFALEHPEPGRPRVELHWRVHWSDEGHGTAMVARAQPGPDRTLRLAQADELATLLLCYARDGFVGVRLASDLAGWWDRHGAGLPPAPLDALAAEHPRLGPVLAAAARAAERVAGIPASGLLSERILAGAPRGAVRFVDPVARADTNQLRAQVALVEWALLPRDQWRAFVRRRLAFAAEADRLGDRVLHVPKLAIRCGWAALRGPAGTGNIS